MLDEYADDRVALLVYLGGLLHDAAGELYTLNPPDGPTPGQLFERFLGWVPAGRKSCLTSRALEVED